MKFKTIPTNASYAISLSGEIKKLKGSAPYIEPKDGKIWISLYGGRRRIVDLEWLSILAHFELDLPEEFKDEVFKIRFDKNGSIYTKGISKLIPVFPKPIVLESGHAIIPTNCRYAVSRNGEVIKVKDGKLISKGYDETSEVRYPRTQIYDPDVNKNLPIKKHRLVALTWIENESFLEKPYVNHKDGDPTNYEADNLEWCTAKENNIHAVKNGLRSVKRLKVLDTKTDNVRYFSSLNDVCAYMNITVRNFNSLVGITGSKLTSNRYEIKEAKDQSPWVHRGHRRRVKKVKFRFVVKLNGKTEFIYGLPELRKRFNLSLKLTTGIKSTINIIKAKHPDIQIEIETVQLVGPFQAYNVKTKEITEAPTMAELANIIGTDTGSVRNSALTNGKFVSKGFVCRMKSDEPWDTDFTYHKSAKRRVRVVCKKTGEIKIYNSLRQTANSLSIDRDKVKRMIRKPLESDEQILEEVA